MQPSLFRVRGMTCPDCARSVETALNGLPGVEAKVLYDQALAEVTDTYGHTSTQLREAVSARGYDLDPAEERDGGNGIPTTFPPLHIAIIGSGSAAFAAAIQASDRGARVTIIERGDIIGGTCVNVGCVPSKIALRAAQIRHEGAHHPFDGISRTDAPADRARLLAQIRGRVTALRESKYEAILESRPNITLLRGDASFAESGQLLVRDKAGETTAVAADRILIATGATPFTPPIPGLAETPYWTSTEALFVDTTPASLIVIGSSFVAVELAQAFQRLGTAVTLLARGCLLTRVDPDLGAGLQTALEAEGVQVLAATQAERVGYQNGRFVVHAGAERLEAEQLLIATGRQANTAALNLGAAGIRTDATGAIVVDDHLRSSAANVYAAGDCSTMPQLVYVAAAAGTRAALNMTGSDTRLDLSTVPAVIFTDPAVATVGLDENQAQQAGIDTVSRRLDLEQVPRALANFDTTGFVKLVAEAGTQRLLGAQILAHDAGEMIQTAALAIRHRMTVTELGETLFPYLVMTEGLKLAAQTFSKDVTQLSCCAG